MPAAMQACLRVVLERFPYVREDAARVYERDEDFRELCEEYVMCVEAAERLEGSRPASDAMRREYGALRLRMEAELLKYLQDRRADGER
jgi:ferredoxin